ncbi:MAG: hydroxymethylbilane synthase [Verrucomicrobiae bacterium]|nr:hydroxymethylbilane synthase [Verrucomicrobiae bacterium]NNJ41998.1 hydroxymethylbilane synthase [Akkermansiaceae bacterium]
MKPLIVGTRGSALALAQAEMTEAALRRAFPDREIIRKVITTTGDRRTDVPLSQVAKVEGVLDKGVFTKELEVALEQGEIDLAVHSMKDVPTVLAEPFEIVGALERAPVADVLVCSKAGGLDELPEGATVATGSVRRQRQLLWLRPDLHLVDIRGNVPTRLQKLRDQDELDAIMLAEAGLVRLGYDLTREWDGGLRAGVLDADTFLPAAGQGIVGFEIRSDHDDARACIEAITHGESMLLLRAEREFLRLLDAGCHTPVGVRSWIKDDQLHMAGRVFDETDESGPMESTSTGLAAEPEQVAGELFTNLS